MRISEGCLDMTGLPESPQCCKILQGVHLCADVTLQGQWQLLQEQAYGSLHSCEARGGLTLQGVCR